MDFECRRCGKCCIELWGTISATKEDLARWQKEGRKDILKYVSLFTTNGWCRGDRIPSMIDEIIGADFGVSPKTDDDTKKCPFLKRERSGKFTCLIQETKPSICKTFPFDGEIKKIRKIAIEMGCRGLK